MIFRPAQLGMAKLDRLELEQDKKACRKIGPCGVGKKALYLNSFYIVRLLDDGRKDFHIIPEIQIVLQHVIPKLFHRERTLRHLGHKGVAQVLGPELLHPLIEPPGKLLAVSPAHL